MAVTATNLVVGNATVTIGSDLGAIKDGVTITPTFTVFNVDLEQELMSSRFWYTDKNFKCEFTLCEPTLANVKIAWDVTAATSGSGPILLNFGTASGTDFVPTNRVLAVTSFVPGASLFTRSVIFDKALLETPGPTAFSKRQETNLKCTFNCAYDTTNSRVGKFSDATA